MLTTPPLLARILAAYPYKAVALSAGLDVGPRITKLRLLRQYTDFIGYASVEHISHLEKSAAGSLFEIRAIYCGRTSRTYSTP